MFVKSDGVPLGAGIQRLSDHKATVTWQGAVCWRKGCTFQIPLLLRRALSPSAVPCCVAKSRALKPSGCALLILTKAQSGPAAACGEFPDPPWRRGSCVEPQVSSASVGPGSLLHSSPGVAVMKYHKQGGLNNRVYGLTVLESQVQDQGLGRKFQGLRGRICSMPLPELLLVWGPFFGL